MHWLLTVTENRFAVLTLAAVAVATCTLLGCQGGQDATDEPAATSSDQGNEASLERMRERAEAAKEELFQRLSGRLMAVMSEQGPVAAIAVCSEEAIDITRDVGAAQGVSIGRTSFRLRNSNNLPPSWAGDLVEQRVEEPAFVELPNNHLGALFPIRLQPQCLLCHGAEENIPDQIQSELASRYPDDQATGFEPAALRGWFWVEVPPLADEDAGRTE